MNSRHSPRLGTPKVRAGQISTGSAVAQGGLRIRSNKIDVTRGVSLNTRMIRSAKQAAMGRASTGALATSVGLK